MASRPRTAEFSAKAAILGQKVRAGRAAKKWSQLKLAEVADISYRQIQLIEGNQNNEKSTRDSPQPSNPKLDTVYRLAMALDLDIGYLVDSDQPVQ